MRAEKVENREEFIAPATWGMSISRAISFAAPEGPKPREIPANRVNYLRMLKGEASVLYRLLPGGTGPLRRCTS
jgi:hypothetical protein